VSATQQFTTTTIVNAAPTAPTNPYSNNDTAQSGQTNPTDITDTSPAFSAIYNDPDPGDTANKYRVEVNTQSDFLGTTMWDSGPSGTSMANTTEGNRCPDIIYAGSALADATTYYWRITFWDDDGAQGTVSATQQFTTTTLVNAAPTAPTTPYSNNTTAQSGQTNPTDITDTTPAFSAIYADPDPGDTANKYRVEVNTQSDFLGTTMWDSGASGTTMADTTEGNRSPDIIYAGSALADATTYYWRITFWDDDGAQGTVSATQQFTTTTLVNAAPTAPTTPYSNNNTAQSGYHLRGLSPGGCHHLLLAHHLLGRRQHGRSRERNPAVHHHHGQLSPHGSDDALLEQQYRPERTDKPDRYHRSLARLQRHLRGPRHRGHCQ
jgi:hypothetical protein